MQIVNSFKKLFITPRYQRRSRTVFTWFLQILLLITSYGGAFAFLGMPDQVYANYNSTAGWQDCSTLQNLSNAQCYFRGTYEVWSGWNANMQCEMTNRIRYTQFNPDRIYHFCHHSHGGLLDNVEVIVFVKWNIGGTGFQILQAAAAATNINQPPNQPSMIQPQSGWEMGPVNNGAYSGVTCNTSGTGQGCSVDFRTQSFDPDFYQSIRIESVITRNQGGNRNYSADLGTNNQTYSSVQNLNDGHWNFSARNCDTTGACSGFTSPRSFLVDTTAPTGVSMVAEPAFSQGLQNNVVSTIGTDAIAGGIRYEFQVDDDPTFASPNNSSGWIVSNNFTFAGLQDETNYYYRVRARDRLNNTGGWSASTSSIQDNIAPQIQDLQIDNERISPENQDGNFDQATLDFTWIEKYPANIIVEVLNGVDEVVFDFSEAITVGSETPEPYQFIWDGKDKDDNFVIDGPYIIKVTMSDLAGNATIDDSSIVIVDNMPADINVSTPVTGSWFNIEDITINGQTEADATATITNNQTSITSPLTLDYLGLFEFDDEVQLGANSFTLYTEDIVKVQNQIDVQYYYEDSTPTISNVLPNSTINNRLPEISVDLLDTGYDDGSDNYVSGIDPDSLFISLEHPTNGELVLVNGGVNVQPTLGNIEHTCNVPGTFGNSLAPSCNYKFVFTSELIPDGLYTITANAKDIAGNSATEVSEQFILDSNILSEIVQPTDGSLLNYSQVAVSGYAEKGSQISVSLPNGDLDLDGNVDNEVFILDPLAVGNDPRVEISNCRASDSPSTDGIVQICDWVVNDFQLERDLVNNVPISNIIEVRAVDQIEDYPTVGLNAKVDQVTVETNLYAVTLGIDTDIEYFSPNGDGKQDGVQFQNLFTDANLGSYSVTIYDANGFVVRQFNGTSSIPSTITWDGKDSSGEYVEDGEYSYTLSILTSDDIPFATQPKPLYAATVLTDNVIITNPKNNSFSSRGVITVQGQAPTTLIEGIPGSFTDIQVKICVDTIAIPDTCDSEFYTSVNESGFFTSVILLPRINAEDEHFISATALDKYGNETPQSNIVKVTTTINPPFESVQILPVLTGTNNPEAYQIILDKLDNNQEITQADIDSLRSVIMRSNVYYGTERVKFRFADHSSISEIGSEIDWDSIGYITGDNSTNLYEEFTDGVTPYTSCPDVTCSWDFYFPIAPQLSGLYEVEFEGKLDVEIERISVGFRVDGNIPLAPIILDVNKSIDGVIQNTNHIDNTFYSNSEVIQLRGAADPNAHIEVKDQQGNIICTTTATPIGMWSCVVDLSLLPQYENVDSEVFALELDTFATLGLNTSQSIDPQNVVIDKILPQILSKDTASIWRQSGDLVDLHIVADENLRFAITVDKQLDSEVDRCINSFATFRISGIEVPIQLGAINDLLIDSSNQTNASGAYTVSGNALEGRYCNTIRISDRAGNIYEEGFVVNLDNTKPDKPFIDTSEWGKYNGIKTKILNIAKGRLVPEFVHEESQVTISGWSERDTVLELFVNAQSVSSSTLVNSACKPLYEQSTIFDGVTVKHKDICKYDFVYPLTENGKEYVFQVKAVDRSGNYSLISQNAVVYYDNQSPNNPQVVRTSSPSYNPTPGWVTGNSSSITKDLSVNMVVVAESLSDLEFTTNGPLSFSQYIFTQTAGDRSGNATLNLGTLSDERSGCTQLIDTRRIGTCEDGLYNVNIKSTDAAGNPSPKIQHVVERDTVRPAKGGAKLSINKANRSIDLQISEAEKNAEAVIKVWGNGQTWYYRRKITDAQPLNLSSIVGTYYPSTTYTVELIIEDSAKNRSEARYVSITTPADAFCVSGSETGLTFPLRGNFIRSNKGDFYAQRSNSNGTWRQHNAQDFTYYYKDNPMGKPIYSAGEGIVANRGVDQYGGLWVLVWHPELNVYTFYLHFDTIGNDIQVQKEVDTNTVLGTMGNTGQSTGPHLHFEVRQPNGTKVDPMKVLGECRGTGTDNRGDVAGTADDPWGGKTADDLDKPKIIVKKDRKGNVTTEVSPGPQITYIDSQTRQSSNELVVYGISIYKEQEYQYEYWEQPCKNWTGICIFRGWEWERKKEETRFIKNASVDLYKDGEFEWGKRLGRLWNDTPPSGNYGHKDYNGNLLKAGRWLTSGNLPGESSPIKLGDNSGINQSVKLNYGDKICVRATFYEHDLDANANAIEVKGNCMEIIEPVKSSCIKANDQLLIELVNLSKDSTKIPGHYGMVNAQSSIEAILKASEDFCLTDVDHVAYILATAHLETNMGTFLSEIWGPSDLQKKYDVSGNALGNSVNSTPNAAYTNGDGYRYRGRGFVQITGKINYEKFSKILGIDIVNNPELVQKPETAAIILVQGVRDGVFTSHKLSDFDMPDNTFDYNNARSIVNGDKDYYDPSSSMKKGKFIEVVGLQYRDILKKYYN